MGMKNSEKSFAPFPTSYLSSPSSTSLLFSSTPSIYIIFLSLLCYFSYRSTSEAFVDEIADKTVVQFAVERWMRKNVLTANATYHNKCENVVRAVKGDVLLIDNGIKRSFGFGLHFERFLWCWFVFCGWIFCVDVEKSSKNDMEIV